jgi:signal transduction histidine kinase
MLFEFLTQHREEVLEKVWERLHAANPDRPRDEVMSGLETFVDELVETFGRERGAPPERPCPFDEASSAPEHGQQRELAGFMPWQVVQDYGSVCDVLTASAAERDVVIPAEEFNLLNRAVDVAAAKAIEGFWSAEERDRAASSAAQVGALAHELRNALHSAAMGFAILRKSEVGVRSRTGDAVERALVRMEDMIRRALAEARLEGGVALRIERVAAETLVQMVSGAAVTQRGIRVETAVEARLFVDADPILLESALGNLVQNAVKFSAPGAAVSVRARRERDEALFEVEDRCGGLPPGIDTASLFRPFVQGATDRRGVGLGLSIAQRAVEAHGGHITVRDLPGVGCVFTIALPAAAPPS